MWNQVNSSKDIGQSAASASKGKFFDDMIIDTIVQDPSEETNLIIRQRLDLLEGSDINSQSQSPIFMLPAELRWMIYRVVLDTSDDIILGPGATKPYPEPVANPNRRALVSTCRRLWMEARQIGISSTPLILRSRQSLVNFNNMRREDMKEIKHIVMMSSLFGEPLLFEYLQRYCLKSQLLSPRYFTMRILKLQSMGEFAYARSWLMMGLKSVDVYVLEVLPNTPVNLGSYPYNEFNALALKTPFCGDYTRLLRSQLFFHGDHDGSLPGYVFAWSRVLDHDANIKLLKGIGISGLLEWYQEGIGFEEEVDANQ